MIRKFATQSEHAENTDLAGRAGLEKFSEVGQTRHPQDLPRREAEPICRWSKSSSVPKDGTGACVFGLKFECRIKRGPTLPLLYLIHTPISCMFYDDIKNFNKQFEYEPRIEKAAKLKKFDKFVIAGMGGSHLAGDLLKIWRPELDVVIWSNYGLPPFNDLRERLVIASSYSGNTDEAVSAFLESKNRGIKIAAVAAGGKLLRLAEKFKTPYVAMPDIHIQPRLALGLSLKSILALMGEKKALSETGELAAKLKPARFESAGRELAKTLHGSIPIIYSSLKNFPIAYNWKVKFNETGKIPAFCNYVPELNHNEMIGFDVAHRTAALSGRMHFVFLKDKDDDTGITRRMTIMEGLFRKRGLKIEVVLLHGENIWQKIFSSLLLADWTSYYTAELYGVEAEQVPMVEEFKKLVR